MKRLCVFCGSREGQDPRYVEAATSIGRGIAKAGVEIVYGAGNVGIMGAVAEAALAAGGKVTGVIPKALVDLELAHQNLTDLYVVNSMHERKAMMAGMSDAFVALPGGLGTYEEFFEVLTWAQLGLHAKPCFLFQVNNFYQPLLQMLDHGCKEGFIADQDRSLVMACQTVEELLEKWRNHVSSGTKQWIQGHET